MRDGRERKEGALVVVGHGGLTSDEVATARKSRKRPHQRLTGCVEATTSKRRSRRSLELAGQRVFAKTRELGEGEAPAAMAGGFGLRCGRREKKLGLATRSGRCGWLQDAAGHARVPTARVQRAQASGDEWRHAASGF